MNKKAKEMKHTLRLVGGLRIMVYDVEWEKRNAELNKQGEKSACVQINS
jgi:hypothetical protein